MISSGIEVFSFNFLILAFAVIILFLSSSVGFFGRIFLPDVDASDLSSASFLISSGSRFPSPNGTCFFNGDFDLFTLDLIS